MHDHPTDPADGPFDSRPQAEAAFAGFAAAAARGHTGPPGEQITYTLSQFLADAITDTIESNGGQLGAYDRMLIAHLGGYLDAVEVATVCSWIRRTDRDRPEMIP
jgi:hypothetical protein